MFNDNSKFDIDLNYGQILEKQVADILQGKTIEVKSERDIWIDTGNIAIEFESRGKKSGIAVTEADYWFHNLTKTVDGEPVILSTIILPVQMLKRYILANRPRVVKGGDNNTSKLFLINLHDFFDKLGEL